MEFNVKAIQAHTHRTQCLVIGVFENQRLSDSAARVNEASSGQLLKQLKRSAMSGKVGETLMLHELPALPAERVLLAGCGAERDFDEAKFHKTVTAAMRAALGSGAKDALSCLTELKVKDRDSHWLSRQAVVIARDASYRFVELKSEKNAKQALRRLTLNLASRRNIGSADLAVTQAAAISDGTDLAKDLGNLPGNICTPSYLAEAAKKIGKSHKSLKVTVLNEANMKKLGMGCLLSVAQGSEQPPKLISLEYAGGKKDDKPVVLVGKGVTFDSGGISIKPSAQMDEMKFDMCGAAATLGTVKAVAELGLPVNLVGLVPATENLPGGNATKPGDIVTSMSGQTVEVLNTDAEGRLILCDALTYAERFKPDVVIDIATLTGACVVALGAHPTGLFTNHAPLGQAILEAGAYARDRAWEMPLWDEYQEELNSNFADIANIGGRYGGAITAACFLSRFTKDYRWAHLDIAGVAWKTGKEKGATGRPVSLLTQYLINRSARGRTG